MSRSRIKGGDKRDGQTFAAVPFVVLDSPAYRGLSMHARALLFELFRQYMGENNGQLLLSRNFMGKRGWKSADMLTKAKRELLDAELIFETVKGGRPNKASWYALTCLALDQHDRYDPGASKAFRRGAYMGTAPMGKPKPSKVELRDKWRTPENEGLVPPHGERPQG